MESVPIARSVLQFDVGKKPLYLCDEEDVTCFVGIAERVEQQRPFIDLIINDNVEVGLVLGFVAGDKRRQS